MTTIKNARGTPQTERRMAIDIALNAKHENPELNVYVIEVTTAIGSIEYCIIFHNPPDLDDSDRLILILED